MDFASTNQMFEIDLSQQKRFRRKLMIRKFTVRAINNCEMFTLTIEELEKMKMEFPEVFVEIFKNAFESKIAVRPQDIDY